MITNVVISTNIFQCKEINLPSIFVQHYICVYYINNIYLLLCPSVIVFIDNKELDPAFKVNQYYSFIKKNIFTI